MIGQGDRIVSHRMLGQEDDGGEEAGAQDQELEMNQTLKMTVGKLRSLLGFLVLLMTELNIKLGVAPI